MRGVSTAFLYKMRAPRPKSNTGYFPRLIGCPAIILAPYGLHKLPSGEFHAPM